MLEIKHLTKIYKTKGGVDTKALDDVSISFPETGLVFLLGKSGSGKSTLLNLAGGLDEPTSGEVIVMGKSSKDFSGSDFDSYRNTFVGFVFQEYNVLNEFNVEDNIALALELQGKKKDREKINSILRDVELEAFAKRRPNTLSGGQKQRIAIARALIKDPQIIMADEPTGALDSATGKQVFDTLKHLSTTRLVIVVSHDREFAEIYGDRIVELADGKIISDITKTKVAPVEKGAVTRIGENTLSVRRDKPIDRATLDAIGAFLSEGEGEVLITKDGGDIANFKRVNRIGDDNKRETFRATEADKIGIKEYDGKQTKFIRSKLPAGKAIKIGAAGLKLKPFRLVLTIFLSFVAFTLFGLFSTMMLYNKTTVAVNAFKESDSEYVMLQKYAVTHVTNNYDGDENTYDNEQNVKFTPAELKKLGGDNAIGLYRANLSNFFNLKAGNNSEASNFYQPQIAFVGVLPQNHPLRQTIVGEYPTEENEICISSYLFDCIKNMTFRQPVETAGGEDVKDEEAGKEETPDSDITSGEFQPLTVNSESDVLKTKLIVSSRQVYTITGVFQSEQLPSKFEALKEPATMDNDSLFKLSMDYSNFLREGLSYVAFGADGIGDEFQNNFFSDNYMQYFDYMNGSFGYYPSADNGMQDNYWNLSDSVAVYDPATVPFSVLRFDGGNGKLKDDELIVSVSSFDSLYSNLAENSFDPEAEKQRIDDEYYQRQEDLNARVPDPNDREKYPQGNDDPQYLEEYDAWQQEQNELDTWHQQAIDNIYEKGNELNRYLTVLRGDLYDSNGDPIVPTQEEIDEAIAAIRQIVTEPLSVDLIRQNWTNGGEQMMQEGNFKIVGFYYSFGNSYNDGLYCSQNFYDKAGVYSHSTYESKYVEEADATYHLILVPLEKTDSYLHNLLEQMDVTDPATDISYSMENSTYQSVETVDEFVEMFSLIFLIVGLVLAVFSALLLFNFISLSISNKKKEIGILRAVGARGTDVFKIFFAESGIIVGICTVLALIGSFVVTKVINNVLRTEAGLSMTLFSFGPLSILLIVGIALFVALLGTFLPVYLASRKKPVESIRAL